MESGNRLGIYLRENRATVVCLAAQGREKKLLDCFSVSVEGEDANNQQLLTDHIVQACRQRKAKFTESAVALDCAAFMQHTVHSEFSDPKRIAATVRFDTEEALATDVSDMAVAFRVVSSGAHGSSLDVFTAPRGILSDILLSLQKDGIDPVAVDPDVYCLARYLVEHATVPESSERSTLYAMLSDSRGYLVVLSPTREISILRTFLIGSAQDRTSLLARETLVTTALAETMHPVGRLCAFDAAGQLVARTLHERTGLEVSTCDLVGVAGIERGKIADGPNAVDFALAYGAALAPLEKGNTVNLRNDHMPFLGKKRRMQSAVRFLSISVTILLLAVGVYIHSQLIRVNKQREDLHKKLEIDYLPVMPGEKKLPPTMKEAVEKLEKTLRRLRAEKTGVGADQESVSAKLELVLKGLNGCAHQTKLGIDAIEISSTNITITGDTSSRQNTVDVMAEAMKKVGLLIDSRSVRTTEDGRDAFTMSLKLASDKKVKGA